MRTSGRDHGSMAHPHPAATLTPVDAASWREVAAVSPAPGQDRWVAPVTYYLCLCLYDCVWQPLAVRVAGETVGFAMWALDADEGSHWIGGVVLDARHQGRGIGRATVLGLLELFEGLPGYREAALSVAPDNTVAAQLYRSLGFAPSGELVDDELVMRRPRP